MHLIWFLQEKNRTFLMAFCCVRTQLDILTIKKEQYLKISLLLI